MDSFSKIQAIISDKTLVNTENKLSDFAATTSAELAGVISNETGSGLLVYGTSPNITTPTGIVKGDVGLGNVENTTLSTWTGSENITTIGTIGTGTWQGSIIDHERGGLETNVSAYSGLLKISGGTTSQVTDNSSNWNTAFGWGNHSIVGYLENITAESIGDLSDVDTTGIADGKILKYSSTSGNWEIGIDEGGAGATEFTGLTDTPANYTGSSLKFARVNVGETALEFAAETDPTVDTDAEIKAILVDEVTKTGTFTAGKIAKINNSTGIIEQGTNTDTDVADAVTKKHAANADTDLDPTFEATFVKKADTVNVLSDITSPGADIEDAVTKKHTQNTDTALGTQTQDLNMGTHKIIGVVDPVNPQEAATKAYADTKVTTEVDPTVDSDAEIKAILVDEITKTGDFTAGRLPEINNSSGIIEQSDIEHKANGGYDFNANSAGFTTQTAVGDGDTTCDWRIGLKYRFVFGAQDETFTFTNPEFSCHLQIILIQDGTGSRGATWPAGIYWANGTIPTLSTAANARDTVNFFFDDYDDVYYGMGTDFAIP
ncbi:hypothetical protein ES705_39109 [subsurface metagenome]